MARLALSGVTRVCDLNAKAKPSFARSRLSTRWVRQEIAEAMRSHSCRWKGLRSPGYFCRVSEENGRRSLAHSSAVGVSSCAKSPPPDQRHKRLISTKITDRRYLSFSKPMSSEGHRWRPQKQNKILPSLSATVAAKSFFRPFLAPLRLRCGFAGCRSFQH